ELAAALESYRPELAATPAALEAADFVLHRPPVRGPARAGYALIGRGAVATLPRWARRPLGLADHPVRDATLGRLAGAVAARGLRWVLGGLDGVGPDHVQGTP